MLGRFVTSAFLGAVVFLLALGQLPSGPERVLAHSLLDHADPPVDAQLKTPPARLTLYFTGGIVKDSSWIQLKDGKDTDLPVEVGYDPTDTKVMYADLGPPVSPGVYTVKWQTLSSDDDDYVQDSYKLTVLNPDGSIPGGAANSRTGSSAKHSTKSGGSGTTALVAFLLAALVITAGIGVVSRMRAGSR